MLAAAKLDPTIIVLPNRIIDMTTLVQQIRRFLADVGGPSTMSLPPANKETRKNVHEMAVAFGLNSQSKGNGNARYTTLIKTSRSGVTIDERKVAKIVRSAGGGEFVRTAGKKGGRAVVPKHKEGEEVGKVCDFSISMLS
jgi:R3H domain